LAIDKSIIVRPHLVNLLICETSKKKEETLREVYDLLPRLWVERRSSKRLSLGDLKES
jgi:hypothetical protein